MYIIPQDMHCKRCGHEGKYSEHALPPGVMLTINRYIPCPVCFEELILNMAGVMQHGKADAYRET